MKKISSEMMPSLKAGFTSTGTPLSQNGSETPSSGGRNERAIARMQAHDLTTLTDLSRQSMRRQTELSISHRTDEAGLTWTRRTSVLAVPEQEARESLTRLKVLLTPASPKQVADLLALMAQIYPVTRKTENQEGAAAYWISIFTKQPVGAVLLGFEDYVKSEADFMPSPGKLLKMVEPYKRDMTRQMNMLESAFSGEPIDKALPMNRKEALQWKALTTKAKLLAPEIAQVEAEKARRAEPMKEWTEEEAAERKARLKAQIRGDES